MKRNIISVFFLSFALLALGACGGSPSTNNAGNGNDKENGGYSSSESPESSDSSDATPTDTDPCEYTLDEETNTYYVSGCDYNFFGEYGIKSIEIASTYEGLPVTAIGVDALSNLPIESVTVPNSVTSVKDGALGGCEQLKYIYLPDTLTEIGKDILNDTAYYATQENWENGVLYLGKYLLNADASLSQYTVKNGTKLIASKAFSACSALTDITVPDSLLGVGKDAFDGCPLENVVAPISFINEVIQKVSSTIKNVEVTSGNDLPVGVFQYFDALTTVKLADSVTAIGDYAFDECDNLTNVIVGDGLETIGEGAFYRCSSLVGINLPDGLQSVGGGAFYDCTKLVNVYFGGTAADWLEIEFKDSASVPTYNGADLYFNGNEKVTELTIPDGVTKITGGAFYKCSSLEKLTIPATVLEIGHYAFAYCNSLTDITVENSNVVVGDGPFLACLVEIASIPASLIEHIGAKVLREVKITGGECIAASALLRRTALQKVEICSSVTSIGDAAFQGCTSLNEITLPDSLTAIGSNVFWETAYYHNEQNWYEDGLYVGTYLVAAKYNTSFTIKDGTTLIADGVLYGFTVADVYLPISIQYIGKEAFKSCEVLERIRYAGTETQWQNVVKGTDWDKYAGRNTSSETYQMEYNSQK